MGKARLVMLRRDLHSVAIKACKGSVEGLRQPQEMRIGLHFSWLAFPGAGDAGLGLKCSTQWGRPPVSHIGSAGGQGQYGRVVGYIEPLSDPEPGETVRFENNIVGNAIPPGFLPACEKGFIDATNSGQLIGHPVEVTHTPLRTPLGLWSSFIGLFESHVPLW